MNDPEILSFATPLEWENWLGEHVERQEGIWLRFFKKATGIPSVTYEEALEQALRFGWIDGQKKGYDEQSYMLRFTPRRKKSVWSQVNVGKVEKLIAEGRMLPSGLAAAEAAKADGRWARAYAPQSTITVPDDFRAALDRSPAAAEFFAGLKSAQRYSFLYRVHGARTPEKRAQAISAFVAMLEAGDTFH